MNVSKKQQYYAYIKVIQLLAQKKSGMTRIELLNEGGFEDNGRFSEILHDLEWCGFIRSYTMMGHKSKCDIFQLMDHYTLFYYEFLSGQRRSSNFWSSMAGTPKYNTWCGLAFERVGLWHVDQIKKKLGISGIMTSEYSWRRIAKPGDSNHGAQIDLLIDRSDGIIDMCEMKYSKGKYTLTSSYCDELTQKQNVLRNTTNTSKAIHTVMVTTDGVTRNAEWGEIQAEVTLDDMFDIN